MIKVALIDESMKQSEGRTFYVDTDCFHQADEAARDQAESAGIDLARYCHSAMTAVKVLSVQTRLLM